LKKSALKTNYNYNI
jgi:hypothetical protein